MAYDLSYFSRTYNSSTRANGSSQAMLNRWPFLCSRQALIRALTGAGLGSSSVRNFQNISVNDLTDKIIDLFDQFMYDNWSNYYTPKGLDAAEGAGYRWDQEEFWTYNRTQFIFHNGNGAGVGIYVLDNVEIVILPSAYYEDNQTEYKHKPFLGFDNKLSKSTFAAELDLNGSNNVTDLTNSLVDAGSFVIGEEYNIREVGDTDWVSIGATSGTFNEVFTATGVGSGTGKARETDGTITDHQSNPINEWSGSSFMFVYDHTYYHDTLGVNGANSTYWYGSTPTNWNNITISDKYFDKAYAAFSTVVSADGKIQSIVEELRPDGDGNNLYGGWGYDSSHHRQTLSWFWDANGDGTLTPLVEGWNGSAYVKAPEVRIDTTQDHRATDYSGNEAVILFPQHAYDYFPGKNLPVGATLYGYAIYGITGSDAYDDAPDALPNYDNVWEKSLPYWGVQPMSVRIVDERPAITATTRSLNTHTVGTGAQRYSFEFEYPPMEYEEAKHIIAFYEKAQGTVEKVRIGIPNKAIRTVQSTFYKAALYKASNTIKVSGGTTGATDLTLEGLEPNSRELQAGTFFAAYSNGNQKIHQIIETEESDDWGRQNIRVYPPLRGTLYNLPARTAEGSHSGLWFLIEAYVVDDSFEYTVDAAGHYRISLRFIEALN